MTSLRSLGVPTTADEYGQAFTVAGIASLAAVLIGGFVGGGWGERWHGKLLARAVDPTIGTEAAARQRAQSEMARAEQERTGSFERARTANPLRSRRADRDTLAHAGGDPGDPEAVVDPDGRARRDSGRRRNAPGPPGPRTTTSPVHGCMKLGSTGKYRETTRRKTDG